MNSLFVFLFVTLAQFALGQVAPPPGTPQCLITCASQFCPTATVQCECVDQISNITVCVLSTCSAADQATAAKLSSEICNSTSSSSTSSSSSAPPVQSASSAVSSASVALSSASEALSSASSVASSTSAAASSASVSQSKAASSAAASASKSASAAASSAAPTSDATRNHNSAIGVVLLGLAGIAAGFALL